MNAAAELFAHDGNYQTSVRGICNASQATYYYFRDKEHLPEELINETYYHFDELIKKYFYPDQSLNDVLVSIVNLYIEFIQIHPHLVRFSTFIQSINVRERIRVMKLNRYKNELRAFNEMLLTGQQNGLIPNNLDTILLVQISFGSIVMLIGEYFILEDRRDEFPHRLRNFVNFWIDKFLSKENVENK